LAAYKERLDEEAESRLLAAEDLVSAAHRSHAAQLVAYKEAMDEAAEGRMLAAEDVLSSAHRSYTKVMATLLKDRLNLLRQTELFETTKDEWLLSWTRQAALAARGRQTAPQPVLATSATPSQELDAVAEGATAAAEAAGSPFVVESPGPEVATSSSSGAPPAEPAAAAAAASSSPLLGGEAAEAAAADGGSPLPAEEQADAAALEEGKRRRRPRQVLLPPDTTSFSLLGAVQRMAARPHYVVYRGHAYSLAGLMHDRTANNPPKTLPASDSSSEAVPGLLVDMEGNQYVRRASLASLTSSDDEGDEGEGGSESPLSPSPARRPSPTSDDECWGQWAAKDSRP
jgi:hypothetical protein